MVKQLYKNTMDEVYFQGILTKKRKNPVADRNLHPQQQNAGDKQVYHQVLGKKTNEFIYYAKRNGIREISEPFQDIIRELVCGVKQDEVQYKISFVISFYMVEYYALMPCKEHTHRHHEHGIIPPLASYEIAVSGNK